MAFYEKDIEKHDAPISFLNENEVMVLCGPCSAKFFKKNKIPLDGRHYLCSGIIRFNNGLTLRANFEINTHTFDLLEKDSVIVFVESEKAWFYITDKKLTSVLMIKEDEIFPFEWIPDRLLDYHQNPPYKMKMM